MIPKAILYWFILIVTFLSALWAIINFSQIADDLESKTPENPRGFVPFEEGKINNSL